MEEFRRKLIQKRSAWGDPPGDGSQSMQPQSSREILQCCRTTYNAAATRLEDSDAMKLMLSHKPVDATNCEHISMEECTFDSLISRSSNFKSIRRVSALSDQISLSQEFKSFESEGIPLIIEDLDKHACWPKEEFTLEWFKSHCSPSISVRNVIDGSDKVMSVSDFIDHCRSAPCAESEASELLSDDLIRFFLFQGQERLYGKDVECPDRWRDLLDQIGPLSQIMPGKQADLLSNQPVEVRVKTLMCYLGIGETFTPCHKDPCASLGQNLMCYTECGGSAFWFMTATSDIFLATQYFHSIDREVDHERHVIAIDQLAKAPFPIYIAEQKLGDLVLVPSRSCHQVINKGGITIKTSWSRMTLDGLIAANYHELPIYQRVCRGETYRVKFTAYNTIKNLIQRLDARGREPTQRRLSTRLAGPGTRQRKHIKTFRRLLDLYEDILNDERPLPGFADLKHICDSPNPQDIEEDRIVCDFCGADIFQSFFECDQCIIENNTVESDGSCAICPQCYVDGRTCKCGNMMAMQCRRFQVLDDVRTTAIEVLGKLYRSQDDCGALEKNIRSDKLGVFAAACIKYQSSLSNVSPNVDIGHNAQKHDGMYCSGCRKTHSFQHLFAKYETHAVDALLGSQDQQSYHRLFHGRDRQVYGEHDISAFVESVKAGTRPNPRFQRFHNTAYFSKCLPATQIVRPGYYDEALNSIAGYHQHTNQIFTRKRRKRSLQHLSTLARWSQERFMTPISPLSSLNDLSSDEQVLDYVSAHCQIRRRKRLVIDCVMIPLRRVLNKERNVRRIMSSASKLVEGGLSKPQELEIKPEFIEDTIQQQQIHKVSSNAEPGIAVNRRKQGRPARLRVTSDDKATCTTEQRKDASKQSLEKGNVEKHKTGRRSTKSDVSKCDGRRANSTQTAGQRRGAKKKIPSCIRADDDINHSTPVNKPQRQMLTLARGSTEHPLSGDDSDTVVAQTPQLHELTEQPTALQNTPRADSFIPIHREPSLGGGRENSPVGRAAESAKQMLALVERQPTTDTGEDWMRAPKRRRIAQNPQQGINAYNDSTVVARRSSEPDCAPQLANVLSSALTANYSIPSSMNPTGWRSEGGPGSDVHEYEHPKQNPQQTPLSVEEREKFEKEINRLSNRVAALEKNAEESKNRAVNFILPSHVLSQPHPFYYIPIPVGQIEDRRPPAQNEFLIQGGRNQHLGYQYPQYRTAPSNYQLSQKNRIYGQNHGHQPPVSPRNWKNWHNANRERYRGDSYQLHGAVGVSETNNFRRFNQCNSPVAGPSNAGRYPKRTIGERGRSNQRWSRRSSSSPSRRGGPYSPERGGERYDNDNQHGKEQITAGWGVSHGWDLPTSSNEATSKNRSTHGWDSAARNVTPAEENQHTQGVATGWDSSHGWDSPTNSHVPTDENQNSQKQVNTEQLSHGLDLSTSNSNGTSNQEQECQWEDNYVQDDDGFENKDATVDESPNKPCVQDSDSNKTAAALDGPLMNNPWSS